MRLHDFQRHSPARTARQETHMGQPKKNRNQSSAATVGYEAAHWYMTDTLHGSTDSAGQSGEGNIRNATR